MEVLAGPFYAAAGLLVLAGAAKLLRPVPAAGALRAVGLPAAPGAVRLLGAVEIAVGMWAIGSGSRVAALSLAVVYAGFAGFVVVAMQRAASVSCGCFGRSDAPPGWVHLVIDAAAAGVGVAVAFHPVGSLPAFLDDGPAIGAMFLVYVGLAVYLAYLSLSSLPRSRAVRP